MRVVVIGATGNVGSRLVPALTEDVEVVAVARRPPERPDPGVEWVQADIVTSDLEPILRGADAAVHLAWLIQPSRRPERTWEVNVVGTERVLAAARRAGLKALVYASSIGAYSPHPSDGPVDEDWPTHGIATSRYSREKAYTERMLDAFEREHPAIRVVRLRPGLIFQRAAASEVRRFFLGSLFPNVLAAPRRIPVFPTADGVRFQAVHTDDVATAYRAAVLSDVHGAFNVAADPVLDLHAVADLLGARHLPVPRRALRPLAAASWRLRLHPVSPGWVDLAIHSPVMDTGRARRELGWRPAHSAEEALLELLRAIAAGRGGETPTLRPDRRSSRRGELLTGQGAEYSRDGRTD